MSIEQKYTDSVICEILGLAGVGKSSLLAELKHQDLENIGISFSDLASYPLQLIVASKVLPVYLKILMERKVENRPVYAIINAKQDPMHIELKNMMYLQLGIELFAKGTLLKGQRTIIFDQGPIFKLVWLYLFGSIRYSETAMHWWRNMANAWAKHLTCCVFLTARVPVLLDRVHSRESNHTLKQLSTKDCNHFFLDYQKAFDFIMEKHFSSQETQHLIVNTETNDIKAVGAKVAQFITAGG